MKAFKFYIFRISLAAIFGLLPMTVWAGDKLTHYEGIANKKGDYNLRLSWLPSAGSGPPGPRPGVGRGGCEGSPLRAPGQGAD